MTGDADHAALRDLIERAGRWAIASREVVHDWSERRACGPRMPRADAYRPGLRNRSDVSYER
jgi:hypothetical protein